MDQHTWAQSREAVFNQIPACTHTFYILVSSYFELAEFFPDREHFEAFLLSQFQPPLAAHDLYTEEFFARPYQRPQGDSSLSPISEAWLFSSCLAFKQANPNHRLFTPWLFAGVSNRYVAVAVLRYLDEPRYLNPRAAYFADVQLWLLNLARCPRAFRYLPDALRDNVDLARLAFERQPDMLKFAGPTVQGYKAVARVAIERDGLLLVYCSTELRSDIGFVEVACRQNTAAARFISRAFLLNHEMVNQLHRSRVITMERIAEDARWDFDSSPAF